MGVPGLWTLLEPARRPIELEQLVGKVVAIDMNIWLHQAVKSRAANAGPRTYLAVLFRRLCKLIYFGIRPVFVFDGDVPALKRATMVERRKRRGQLGDKARRAQERLLHRLLRRIAENSVIKSNVSPEGNKSRAGEHDAKLELIRRLHQRPDVQQAAEDAELFSAPADSAVSELDSNGLLHEQAGMEYDDLARDYLDGFNLHAVGTGLPESELDLHSDTFCALPLQAQLRVVQLAREQLDTHPHAIPTGHLGEREPDLTSETFSNRQIGRLLLRRRLAERHEELSADLAREEAARQVARLNNPLLTAALASRVEQPQSGDHTDPEATGSQTMCTTALRIQSEDAGHAILIKRSPLKLVSGRDGTNIRRTQLTLESLIHLVHQAEEQAKNGSTTPEAPIKMNKSSSSEASPCSAEKVAAHHAHETPVVKLYEPSVPQPYKKESPYSETNSPDKNPPNPARVLFHDLPESVEVDARQKPHSSSHTLAPSERTLLQSDSPGKQLDQIHIVDKSADSRFALEVSNMTDGVVEINHGEIESYRPVDSQAAITSTISEESPNVEGKGPRTSDVVGSGESSVNDENDDDDEDDDEFVDVPLSDDPLVRHGETDHVISSDDSVSETDISDVKEQITHAIDVTEQPPIISEGWVEDDEAFALDDDVLREEADRLVRQAQTTTTKCITEAQELLQMFGMPFVISPEEAEAQCVTLQRTNVVDLVASDDSDVWPFGARYVCRHLFGASNEARSKAKHHLPSCYRLEDLQDTLGLDVANILRLAMLCGSDYTPGIQNVGPVTAVEILSEFARQAPGPTAQDEEWTQWLQGMEAPDNLVHLVLEPLKQFVDWWHNCGSNGRKPQKTQDPKLITSPVRRKWLNLRPPPGFPDAKIIQAYLRPNVKTDLPSFKWETPSVELLVKHAHSILGWSRDSTEAMLSAVLKRQQQRALSAAPLVGPQLITHYFSKSSSPMKNTDQMLEQNAGKCEEPDEVSLPSKRARKATSRLRPKRESSRSVPTTEHPDDSQASNQTDFVPSLSELPTRSRPRRGSRIKGSGRSKLATQKKTESKVTATGNSAQRRVVTRVALSEDEEESDSGK